MPSPDINTSKVKLSINTENIKTKRVKVQSPMCLKCKKKMSTIKLHTCKCGHSFCRKCKFPEKHDCQYDFKAAHRKKLETNFPKIKNKKL